MISFVVAAIEFLVNLQTDGNRNTSTHTGRTNLSCRPVGNKWAEFCFGSSSVLPGIESAEHKWGPATFPSLKITSSRSVSCAETLPCFTKQLLPSRSNGAPLNLTRRSGSAVAGGALQCSDYLLLSQWQLCPRGERRKCPYRGKGGGGDYKWLTRPVWDRARLSPSLPRVARWPTVLPALLTAGRFHDAPPTPGGT